MRRSLWALLILLTACPSPRQTTDSGARDEVLAEVMVDVGVPQTVEITRRTLAGEASPVRSEITVMLLDQGSVRLEPDSITITTDDEFPRVVVEFVAPDTRPLRLFVHWGAAVGSSERPIRVVDLLDSFSDFEVTYVDRVDSCLGRVFRLPSGRVVCSRGDAGITVYDPDGGFEAAFAGFNPAARGDELWTDTLDGLEHRTDVPSGLRFDGLFAFARGTVLGDSRRGASLRSTVGDAFIEVTWDGGALNGVVLDGLTSVSDDSTAFRVDESIATTRLGNFPVSRGHTCLVTRGCSTVSCPPVVECLDGFTVGLTAREIYLSVSAMDSSGIFTSSLVVRPRATSGQTAVLSLPASASWPTPRGPATLFGNDLSTALEPMTIDNGLGQTLIPRVDGARTWVEVWQHGGTLVGADDAWLIAAVSPFKLRFHRVTH